MIKGFSLLGKESNRVFIREEKETLELQFLNRYSLRYGKVSLVVRKLYLFKIRSFCLSSSNPCNTNTHICVKRCSYSRDEGFCYISKE